MSRLPWLTSPLLKFDLAAELAELRTKDSWNRETGRSSKTLAKHADFRLVLILMKAGTRIKEHSADARISIYQVAGQSRMTLPECEYDMKAGELVILDVGVAHEISALEESALLLTIAWSAHDSQHSEVRPYAEDSFDEEAVLRMDDEGASSTPA